MLWKCRAAKSTALFGSPLLPRPLFRSRPARFRPTGARTCLFLWVAARRSVVTALSTVGFFECLLRAPPRLSEHTNDELTLPQCAPGAPMAASGRTVP